MLYRCRTAMQRLNYMLFTVWAAMGYFQCKLQPVLGPLGFPELCKASRADTSTYAAQIERKAHHWCYDSECKRNCKRYFNYIVID